MNRPISSPMLYYKRFPEQDYQARQKFSEVTGSYRSQALKEKGRLKTGTMLS